MRLDVYVLGQQVAKLYREADEYVLQYEPDTPDSSFVSLAMPVRQEAWRWPRDLHPFFRQNLPEGYLLGVIRELFGPLLDGTDLSLLAVVGAAGIGRVAVTVEGAAPGVDLSPLNIEELLTAEKSAALLKSWCAVTRVVRYQAWCQNFLHQKNGWARGRTQARRRCALPSTSSKVRIRRPTSWVSTSTTH